MTPRRVWTLEQANALLPELTSLVREQLFRASEIEKRWKEIQAAGGAGAEEAETELHQRVAAYEQGWRDIEELGVVVKDPRVGLLDFYGRVDDRLVWLCWRLGEPAVDHYHGLDEGFSGRKPIATATRQRMLN